MLKAIGLLIAGTLAIALMLIEFTARRRAAIGDFGFRGTRLPMRGWTAVISLPLAIAAAVVLDHLPQPGPLAGVLLSNDLATTRLSASARKALPLALVAVLFAAVHLEVGR